MKIVIAGGTGFIGNYLAKHYKAAGHEVKIISRNGADAAWNNFEGIVSVLEGADLLLNLAGKSVDCRYNEKNKKAILESRTLTTKILGEAILKCLSPPSLWINSSTATIYRHAEDRPMTESSGEIGKGFSVNVATSWENTFFNFQLPKTRQVALRIAIVLGATGGALSPLKRLIKLGLGGKHGNGRQIFSWIHIDDLKEIITLITLNQEMKGIYNCSSPAPVSNNEFMKTLRGTMGISFGLHSPTWLLTLGAFLIGTETELILKSRWVLPERLLAEGYRFKYPALNMALEDLK